MNDDKTYVCTDSSGKAIGRKFHLGNGCSTFTDTPNYIQVSDHEIGLLGLKLCAVCEKRKRGGPAVEALERFFHDVMHGELTPREAALSISDYLRERSFYIAQRRSSDEKAPKKEEAKS
jgi:hypothetical protein